MEAYTSQQVANLSDHTVATLLNEKHERITDLEAELQLARDQDYQREVLAAANRECKRMAQANAELERTIDSQLGFARELAELKTALSAAEDGKDAKWMMAEMERLMTRDLEWQAVFPGCCHPADLARAVAELRAEVERMEAAKCPCFWCNEGQEPKQPRNAATEARLATLEADLDNARKTVGKLNCDYYDALLEVSSLKAALSAAEAERDAFATEARLASERREADDFEWHNEGCPCPCCQSNLPAPANPNRAKLQAVYDALAEHCQTAKHPSPLLLEQLQSLYRLLEDPA